MKIGIMYNRMDDCNKPTFEQIKSYGFDAVDYSMSDTNRAVYSLKGEDLEKYILNDKATLKKLGLTVSQMHGPWRWPPQDSTEDDRAERMEKMKKSIKAAAIIGCKYWVVHPIMPFGIEDMNTEFASVTYKLNLEFMRELLITAKENNVVICLENMPMPKFSLGAPSQILNFVREINDENFKICLDTGHVNVYQNSCVGSCVRELGSYIKVLHVHDNLGDWDAHLPIGKGSIDWNDFVSALKEVHFDGVFSIETKVPTNLDDEEYDNRYIELCRTAKKLLEK